MQYGTSQELQAQATADQLVKRLGGGADSIVARSMRRKWRDDFPGSALDSNAWTVVETGAGQTITVATSILRVSAGTIADSETIIRSVESFKIPFRANFIATFSQRIANQEIYFEIVDASGQHYASWLFDGTTATRGKFLTGNSGDSLGSTLIGIHDTISVYQIFEIETTPDEVYFYAKTTNLISVRTGNGIRNRQIPDPNLEYFIQIRVKNLDTAPASDTNIDIDAVTVQDIEEITAEVTGGRGGGASNQAIPVSAPAALSVTNIAGRNDINDELSATQETLIALAANGIYTGANRDSATIRNSIRGWVFTDQNGTLIIEQSINNSTWRQTDSIAITGNASQATRYEFKLVARYYRFRYANGANAQTTLDIISTMFNIGA